MARFTPLTKDELIHEISLFMAGTSTHPIVNDWDVSHITDMSKLFTENTGVNWWINRTPYENGTPYDHSMFNEPIGNWDVSNVTNMNFMFAESMYNHPLQDWNVSNVIAMQGMFMGNTAFNQPIGNWDVSNVATMSHMFKESIYNYPLQEWDVSNVEDMDEMFMGNHAFNQPIGNWDVSNVTTMSHMFCDSIYNYPLQDWDVSNVEDMEAMFYDSHAFNQPIGNWDVSNVDNFNNMFRNTIFNQPIGDWDVFTATHMNGMFYAAHEFNQNLNTWIVLVRNIMVMFDGATNMLHENWPRSAYALAPLPAQPAVQQRHEGVAFGIHNAFDDVNKVRLMELIGPEVQYTDVHPFREHVIGFLVSLLSTVDPAEHDALETRFNTLRPWLSGLTYTGQIPLYNTALVFIGKQPLSFKVKYIRSFILDCVSSYDEYDPANPSANRSCPDGVKERIITSMGPAGSEDERYEALVRVLSPLIIGQIRNWGSKCVAEMDTELDAVSTVDEKVSIVRDCIRRKIMELDAGHLSEGDPDPPILASYLIREIRAYFMMGGKRKKRTKKNKLKKRTKKNKRKMKRTKNKKYRFTRLRK
jgi:surface protein